MIVRSSLIQRREDVSSAEFSRHFREVQGPLAARLPKARAYKQNHRSRRWDLPEATFLPRVDAYSQIWFDDVHTMFESMDSPEQAKAYTDFRSISDYHVVTVQEPGRVIGDRHPDDTKLTLILAGAADSTPEVAEKLTEFTTDYATGVFALRINQIIETGDSTSITPRLGAFAEIWLHNDAAAQDLLNRGLLLATGPMTTCWAMQVDEIVLIDGPEF